MRTLRLWIVLSWIALPTVMYGGYSLLHLINHGDRLTPFHTTWFRAGHAHAGVLLLMSLPYYVFLDQTTLTPAAKHVGCIAMLVGILAQSGGFFLHMIGGHPNELSLGTPVTSGGAALLAIAVGILVYGLVTTRQRHAVRASGTRHRPDRCGASAPPDRPMFAAFEVEALKPLIGGTPWLAWMYAVSNPNGVSRLMGVIEISTAILLLASHWMPRAGVAGGALGALTLCVTVSILVALPVWETGWGGWPALNGLGQFLIKDVALLGITLVVLGESTARVRETRGERHR